MALNNFDASIIGRSSSCKSHNVIKKAAYNGREKLTDERTGETFDYSNKDGLEWQGLFVPENAPGWMYDRQTLYQGMERREDQSDNAHNAQLAHSWILALPHELDAEQRRWLMTDFARELSRKGRIVDVAIHEPDEKGDHRNYHAHVIVSMREITPEGFGNKIRAPGSNRKDKENQFRRWAKDELAKWKDRYSELGAKQLERAGFPLEAGRFRAGHLTIPKQREEALRRGDHEYAVFLKDRQATRHMGPQATALERDEDRPVRTRKGDRNRAIAQANEERQQEQQVWLGGRARTTRGDATAEKFQELENRLAARQNRPDLSLPPSDIRGDAEHIWWAYRNAIVKQPPIQAVAATLADELAERERRAKAFVSDIEQRGLSVARITQDDAQHSQTTNFLDAKFHDKYSPKYREGEYVAINERGWVYRINEITTEHRSKEIGAFMRPLDEKAFPSLRTKWNELHEERQAKIDTRPRRTAAIVPVRRAVRKVAREAGGVLDQVPSTVRTGTRVAGGVLGILGILGGRSQTPEQKEASRIAADERRDASKLVEKQRGGYDRDR